MLTWGILGGLSNCLIFTPAVVAVGHWFMKRRALATSLALTAGGVGGAIFPFIILKLEKRVGFSNSMRIVGVICAVLCSIAILTVRTRLPPNTKGGSRIDVKALLEPIYGTTTLAIFLLEFALFIPVTYLTSYALANGVSEDLSYELVMYLNGASVFGRALSGYWADRWGRFRVMILTSAACALLTFLWLAAGDNKALIVAYAVAFGFSSGSIIGVTPVCVAQICHTEDYGKRYGTTYFIVSFGTLIGVPLAGAILEMNGGNDFAALIMFSGCVFFAGMVCFLLANGLAVNWNFRVKF